MNQEKQRIAIAKACGWRPTERPSTWLSPSGAPTLMSKMPDYLNSLDAMHEAYLYARDHYVGTLKNSPACDRQLVFGLKFSVELARIVKGNTELADSVVDAHTINATAAQRAEAFLKTLGLWTEGE